MCLFVFSCVRPVSTYVHGCACSLRRIVLHHINDAIRLLVIKGVVLRLHNQQEIA